MRFHFPLAVGVVAIALIAQELVPASAQERLPGVDYIGTVPDTGQFLPDSAILGRFEDKAITAGEFVESYFNSLAEFRPGTDSAGRVQFLQSMIRKELLASLAWEANRPLNFEDRAVLRAHKERALSNALYQRMVLDSVRISEEDIQALYRQYQRQLKMRHILFADLATARKTRLDLVAGRISWRAAVKKYSRSEVDHPDGELGWALRMGKDMAIGNQLWSLKVGEISQPIQDEDGFHLMQVLEERPYEAPSLSVMRSRIENTLRQEEMAKYSRALQGRLAEQAGMTYDTVQIKAAVALMPGPPDQREGLVVHMDVPHVSPEDTARVLARYRGGVVTLGRVMAGYQDINPLMRPPLDTFDAMVSQIHAVGLESHRADLARRLGLDEDPMVVREMRRREEQLRVEHLYQDSVLTKVWIPSADQRAYYEQNKHLFVTYPKVHFAAFYAPTREGADSLAARLRGGERAEDILAADEARGVNRGSIQERMQRERGAPYHQLLFEVMQPDEVTVVGPDDSGAYAVIHLFDRDPGHQLEYEEVATMIDESLRNMKAEELLKALIERHRPRYAIETYPERVMQIRLVDPLL